MWASLWHHIIYVVVEMVIGVVAGWLLKGKYGAKAVAEVSKLVSVVK